MNPRARNTDPITSHVAAKGAARFAETHKGRILEALTQGPMTAEGISTVTGLTVVQVDRRLIELERAERIEYLATDDGLSISVNGFRVLRTV